MGKKQFISCWWTWAWGVDWKLLRQLNSSLQIHLPETQRSSCQESSDWIMVRIKSDLEEKCQAGGTSFLAACPSPTPHSSLTQSLPDSCCTGDGKLPDAPLWELVSWSWMRVFWINSHIFILVFTCLQVQGEGASSSAGGLCSAAINCALLILLPPRCSENIFNSSLLYASLRRCLIIHFKTRQLFSFCPPSPSDTQRESEF